MKYWLILVIHLIIAAHAFAQKLTYPHKKDSSLVSVKAFYRGYGKIFDIKADNLLPASTRNTVKPDASDIVSAETLMVEKFTALIQSDDRVKSLRGKSYEETYRDFYRQYVGLINNDGDRMVFIQLIKCCKPNIRKCFPEWKTALGNPLDDDPCTITMSYVVNLTQRTVALD